MLPRAQPPRLLISCRLQWQVRRITTTAAGTKRYRQESSTFAADRLKLPVLKTPEQSAYVKTGRFLESPAQALAVIRALERKYGAVNEYHIAKDYELETRYQSIIYLQFKDPESLGRVPANTSGIFHVVTPEILDRPGGVGLDELEPFLERQEYVEEASIPAFGGVMDSVLQSVQDEAENKNANFMECQITRSRRGLYTASTNSPALTGAREVTGHNFIKWGGFQTLKPIEKGTPIPDEELFGPTSIDHIRMRRTLRKWSDLSGAPNPYEYSVKSDILPQDRRSVSTSMHHTQPQEVVEEALADLSTWEPLPGYESEAEDEPIPSSLYSAPVQGHPAQDAKPSPTPTTSASPIASPHAISPSRKGEHLEKENFSNLSIPSQVEIPTPAEITMPSMHNPPSINNATPISQAEKAAQLKAARAVANPTQAPFKKPSNKSPAKGPHSLPRKPRPVPVQEERKNDGVAARLKGLFGF